MPHQPKIGHQVHFPNTLVGLFKRGCWEIPELMGASFMGLIGLGLAALGLYNYAKNDGDNREFKMVYYVVRPDDPRACKIKNPVFTEYP